MALDEGELWLRTNDRLRKIEHAIWAAALLIGFLAITIVTVFCWFLYRV